MALQDETWHVWLKTNKQNAKFIRADVRCIILALQFSYRAVHVIQFTVYCWSYQPAETTDIWLRKVHLQRKRSSENGSITPKGKCMRGKKLSLKSVKVNIPILKFCLNSIEIRRTSNIQMECFLQARPIVLLHRRTWKLLVSKKYSYDSCGYSI